MNRQLLERSLGCDLVFIGKGNGVKRETLCEVRKRGTMVSIWYGDIRPTPEMWLIDLLHETDCYFMTSGGDELRKHKEQGHCKRAAFFFNPTDPDLPTKYHHLRRGTTSIVWTGTRHTVVQDERRKTLEYLQTRNDVQFYGFRQPGTGISGRLNKLKARLLPQGPPLVRGADYIAAIKSGKIGVGVSAIQNIPRYSSDRIAHYTTFGTFYLSWHFPEMELFFDPKRELVSFSSIDDLKTKIDYYLRNEDEREAMAQAGQKRALQEYSTQRITKMMLDVLQNGRSGMFEWEEVI